MLEHAVVDEGQRLGIAGETDRLCRNSAGLAAVLVLCPVALSIPRPVMMSDFMRMAK